MGKLLLKTLVGQGLTVREELLKKVQITQSNAQL